MGEAGTSDDCNVWYPKSRVVKQAAIKSCQHGPNPMDKKVRVESRNALARYLLCWSVRNTAVWVFSSLVRVRR